MNTFPNRTSHWISTASTATILLTSATFLVTIRTNPVPSPILLSFALLIGLMALLAAMLLRCLGAWKQADCERKKIRNELEQSWEQLLCVQRLAQIGYWDWDLKNDEIKASDELLRLLGVRHELKPLTFALLLQRIHPDDRKRLSEAVISAVAGHSLLSLDYRVLLPCGDMIEIRTQAKVELDSNGRPCRIRGTSHNVTDAKRAENELKKSERLLHQVIESLPVGVWILDQNGSAQSMNPAGQEIWSGQARDLQSLAGCEAWCELSGKKLVLENWPAYRALHSGEAFIGELIRIRSDEQKNEKFILSSAIPLRQENNQIIGAVMVHQDITQQRRAEVNAKQAEEKISILLGKANEAIHVREDVLSIVSHDLKNPLTSANLAVQLLRCHLSKLPEHSGMERTAAIIQKSIDNMKALIQGILDISKIQTGTFTVDPEPEEARDILASIREMMMAIAKDKNVNLLIELPNFGCVAFCDSNRLSQVLMNLVGNALKFTPSGGSVRVTCAEKNGFQVFSIEDTGPGIPATQLRHIFERNWQAPATASTGNGLGLFIAKGIVEAHGGQIWAESEPGHGSHFQFTIPCPSAIHHRGASAAADSSNLLSPAG